MSHFTTVKTEIRDLETLKEALLELGYKDIVENDIVRGFMDNQTRADLVVKKKNGFDLGFKKSGNTYNLVADFYGTDENKNNFTKSLTQKYASCVIKNEAALTGFTIADEEVRQDGSIKIVLQKWF